MEDLLLRALDLLLTIPTVLVALSFHECAHAFVANKLGDSTAKSLGRLTLNPMKHIDVIGALCMMLCGFGWAKPVPVDMRQFKNPKGGMAITALAGPFVNLLLGFFGAFVLALSISLIPNTVNSNLAYWLITIWLTFVKYFGILNIYLAIFNLIPLPPFDGSRILSAFLSDKYYIKLMQYERQIALGFFLVLFADSRFFGGYISDALSSVVYWVFNGFISLFNLFL